MNSWIPPLAATSRNPHRKTEHTSDTPAIAQLVEHLTVDHCSNQMVPGSIPGGRTFAFLFTWNRVLQRKRRKKIRAPAQASTGARRTEQTLEYKRRGTDSGPVAQWIRHRPTEPGIAGSSPAGVILPAWLLPKGISSSVGSANRPKSLTKWQGKRDKIWKHSWHPKSVREGGLGGSLCLSQPSKA